MFLEEFENELSEEKIASAISFVDRNGDGLINLKEFIEFMLAEDQWKTVTDFYQLDIVIHKF